MATDLTYAERLLLRALVTDGPQEDRDCTPERVLVNTGLAERFAGDGGWGMIRATDKGRAHGLH